MSKFHVFTRTIGILILICFGLLLVSAVHAGGTKAVIGEVTAQQMFICDTRQQMERILHARMMGGPDESTKAVTEINAKTPNACGMAMVVIRLDAGHQSYALGNDVVARLVQVTLLAISEDSRSITMLAKPRVQFSWSVVPVVTKKQQEKAELVSL